MSNVIRIQSKLNITVTSGLQYEDVTNPDAHIPDRLKVSAEWPKHSIFVKEGVGYYPAAIAEWPTVEALVKSGVFTIAEDVEGKANETDVAKVEELKEKEEAETKKTKKKAKKLEEAVEEDKEVE